MEFKFKLLLIPIVALVVTFYVIYYAQTSKTILTRKTNPNKKQIIWQTAPKEVDNKLKEYMESWKNIPGWKYRFMDDDQVKNFLVNSFPQINFTNLYEEKKILAFDLYRYAIAYAKGGLYVDIDVRKEPTFEASMMELGDCNIIIGIETDIRQQVNYYESLPRSYQLIQWTFYSSKKHPLMRLVTEKVARKIEYYQKRNITLKDKDVMEITGPGIWTDAVLDYILVSTGVDLKQFAKCGGSYKFDDVCILNSRAFEPYQGHSCSSTASRSNTYVINNHYYWGSWKPKDNEIEEKEI